jgi:hypothetical protein
MRPGKFRPRRLYFGTGRVTPSGVYTDAGDRMRPRTINLLFGAISFGMAADLAMAFLMYDQHGAHLLPSTLVGLMVGRGVFWTGWANDPRLNKNSN